MSKQDEKPQVMVWGILPERNIRSWWMVDLDGYAEQCGGGGVRCLLSELDHVHADYWSFALSMWEDQTGKSSIATAKKHNTREWYESTPDCLYRTPPHPKETFYALLPNECWTFRENAVEKAEFFGLDRIVRLDVCGDDVSASFEPLAT